MRMPWPAWLWVGTPLKLWVYLVNRLATWFGVYYLWRQRHARSRFWLRVVLINVLSLGALGLAFFWLHG